MTTSGHGWQRGGTCQLDAVSRRLVPRAIGRARLQVRQAEVLVDLASGRRLVERDEVQAWHSLGQQSLAHLAGDLEADRTHRLRIIGDRKQPLRELGREVFSGQDARIARSDRST